MRKPVKKAAPKKSMLKKGDEPVRAGRAPANEARKKMDNYKKAYKDTHPFGINSRTQYDYIGEDSDGGVYETRSNTGFGRTKSYYKNTYGTSAKKMPTYNFPITYEAVKAKAKKKKSEPKPPSNTTYPSSSSHKQLAPRPKPGSKAALLPYQGPKRNSKRK